MAAEQLPATKYAVGGQSAVANHQVISETSGFEEDGEEKKTAAGQHNCDITYSRRATKTVTLELEDGATESTYMSGGALDASFAPGGTAAWEIRSVQKVNTRGPVQLVLELVSLTEQITAPA